MNSIAVGFVTHTRIAAFAALVVPVLAAQQAIDTQASAIVVQWGYLSLICFASSIDMSTSILCERG